MQYASTDQADHENAFLLGEWQVFPDTGLLVKDGIRIHTEPKVMSVLECLMRAGGKLVTREELIDTVWAHVVINDEVLTRAISELRTLLGDVNRDRRYIATIPKRGYKLLMPARPMTRMALPMPGPVDTSASIITHNRSIRRSFGSLPSAGLSWSNAKRLLGQPVALAACITISSALAFLLWMTPDDPNEQANIPAPGNATRLQAELQRPDISQVLANPDEGVTVYPAPLVLINPLTAITDDEPTRVFAAGLLEDLQHALFRETDLQLVEQLSANQLESAFILSGSVRVYDQSTKVNFQLVEALTSRLLWSSSFECPLDAVLSLQSQIARHTGKNLQRSLSGRV